MIKLKFKINSIFNIILLLLTLSACAVQKEEIQVIPQEKTQIKSTVLGHYELKTSWLQSTVDFQPDGTFQMNYTLSDKQETSGTWTINGDILILKNDGVFPKNKKWLIRNEKLYPILKSTDEYDMDIFYISKKEDEK